MSLIVSYLLHLFRRDLDRSSLYSNSGTLLSTSPQVTPPLTCRLPNPQSNTIQHHRTLPPVPFYRGPSTVVQGVIDPKTGVSDVSSLGGLVVTVSHLGSPSREEDVSDSKGSQVIIIYVTGSYCSRGTMDKNQQKDQGG